MTPAGGMGDPVGAVPVSRYLAPLLERRDPALFRRLAVRWTLCVLLAGGLGSLAYGTRARWFDPHGPGHAAYWLHDAVYLPLKGHLWTQGLPYVLVPWTIVLLLALTGLAGYLSGRPLLRAAHAGLTRRALARPAAAALLDRWHAITAAGPLRARHLEMIVEQERLDLLEALDGVPGAPPVLSVGGRLAMVTALSARLRLRCAAAPAVQVGVAADLFETLLRLERAAGAAPPRDLRHAIDTLSARLAECLGSFTSPPAASPGAADPFAAGTLIGEARALLAIMEERRRLNRPADPVVLRAAAAAVAERSSRLQLLRVAAERRLSGYAADPPMLETPAPAGGRVALLIALAVGHEAAEPELALAYLDALSGVDFARAAGLPPEAAAFADTWLAEAPDLPHWRLAAPLIGGSPSGTGTYPTMAVPGDDEHLHDLTRRLAWMAGTPESTP